LLARFLHHHKKKNQRFTTGSCADCLLVSLALNMQMATATFKDSMPALVITQISGERKGMHFKISVYSKLCVFISRFCNA